MRVIVGRAVAILAMAWGAAAIAAPGEYWDSTTKIDMPGMPMAMPAQTFRFCMAKGLEKDPRSGMDKDCQLLESKMSGNKASFKMRCVKNGETMTGTGDMTFGPDSSDGRMTLTMSQGTVTMLYSTKRVGGACDSDEMKKKADAMVAQSNQQTAQMCAQFDLSGEVLSYSPEFFFGKDAVCASRKDAYCTAVLRESRKPYGYTVYKTPESQSILRSCGSSTDALKKAFCKAIDANNPEFVKGMGDYRLDRNIIKSDCPAEYKVYAEVTRKRYCEGRDYTEKQQMSLSDCLAGKQAPASGNDDGSAPEQSTNRPRALPNPGMTAPTPPPPPATPTEPANNNPAQDLLDGAKKLKGLFGL